MAESEWLRARAVRLQTDCFTQSENLNEKLLALFIRYETTHERAFYRALKELQTLNLRREQFEFKKVVFQRRNQVPAAVKSDSSGQEMAA